MQMEFQAMTTRQETAAAAVMKLEMEKRVNPLADAESLPCQETGPADLSAPIFASYTTAAFAPPASQSAWDDPESRPVLEREDSSVVTPSIDQNEDTMVEGIKGT